MGIRFRRSIRLAPGIRLNATASGLSLTVGPRGASISVGPRGTFLNTGVPGTGLYQRQRIGGNRAVNRATESGSTVSVKVSVSDAGELLYTKEGGASLTSDEISAARRQHKSGLLELLDQAASEINSRIDGLARLHLETPSPDAKRRYQPKPFDEAPPSGKPEQTYGFLGWFSAGRRTRIDQANQAARDEHAQALAAWSARKRVHEEAEEIRRRRFEDDVITQVDAMRSVLEERLQAISWPRETHVSFDIAQDGAVVWFDVDLPEVEDMPTQAASIARREFRLAFKALSATRIRELYIKHIHGIAFRIIGEVFASLPRCVEVVLSGYSQRPDRRTGQIVDEYLFSVRVNRSGWGRINFQNLEQLAIEEALEAFELRRSMSKTGILKPIAPFERGAP